MFFVVLMSFIYTCGVVENAVTSFCPVQPGKYAIWLDKSSEGYELRITSYESKFKDIGTQYVELGSINKLGNNRYEATIQNSSIGGVIEPTEESFKNLKFKLGKLAPGKYEFFLKTQQFYQSLYLRRFQFTIPESPFSESYTENLKMDLYSYASGKEYKDGKITNHTNETVICIPLIYKENLNIQDQELMVSIYDEQGNEVKKIDEFKYNQYNFSEQDDIKNYQPWSSSEPIFH